MLRQTRPLGGPFPLGAYVYFRKAQVRIWLTFEDANYSLFAKVVQLTIILLIIVSS